MEQQREEREQRKAVREHEAAVRRYEKALATEERAKEKLRRAEAAKLKKAKIEAGANRKQLEKEAREAHLAAMQAEVEERNTNLAEVYEDINNLLAATLDKDDYVDLDSLKLTAESFPFPEPELEIETEAPEYMKVPGSPEYHEPPAPKKLFWIFSRKKFHQKLIDAEKRQHAREIEDWEKLKFGVGTGNEKLRIEFEAQEGERNVRLAEAVAGHEAVVEEHNKEIDKLITDLGYGLTSAVEEYVSIVLANSVYPDNFPIDYEHEYESETAELAMKVFIPSPDKITQVKKYSYKKNTDEISETYLSKKDTKDRYENAVYQVALRTLHEVFEADRRALVNSIFLQVGTTATDPATGKVGYKPFAAVGVERSVFIEIALESVVPKATLAHLGASVSKDPLSLIEADLSGIRKI
jgi:restriction system protein